MNTSSIPALCRQTALTLSRMLSHGETTSQDITKAFLQSIAAQNGEINAYLEVYEKEAMAEAAASDLRRQKSAPLSPLDGIPIALKDNIAVKGHFLCCASPMLADFLCPYDSTATERIKAAGMPILGRLNMDELGMGSGSENSLFGAVHNPANPKHTAGGSSGGSAAAVAACMAPWALGSDTGGSVRQPASFCGVVGVRPAYGTISRYGLAAFASSMDQIGVLTKTAEDAALLINILSGEDPRDATCNPSLLADFTSETQTPTRSLEGRTLSLPQECFDAPLSECVRKALLLTVERFEALGARVIPVSLSTLHGALPAYYALSAVEAASNLARYDGIRYGFQAKNPVDLDHLYRETRRQGFGAEVKRRILLGTLALSKDHRELFQRQASAMREAVRLELESLLQAADGILTPVAPTPAPLLGQQANPTDAYHGDLFTVSASLGGLPALSLPCGHSPEGLPIGMQLTGAKHGLSRLLGMAAVYQSSYSAKKGGSLP